MLQKKARFATELLNLNNKMTYILSGGGRRRRIQRLTSLQGSVGYPARRWRLASSKQKNLLWFLSSSILLNLTKKVGKWANIWVKYR